MRPITLFAALLLAFSAVPAGAQRMINLGQTVVVELRDNDPVDEGGRPHNVWRFRAREGGAYLVSLRSEDFDPLLRVGSPDLEGCDDCWIEDDDGGGGLNAQVVFVAPRQGTYEIHAASYGGGTGRYVLSLEDGAEIGSDTVVTLTSVDTVGVDFGADTLMAPMVVPTTDSVVVMPLEPNEWFHGRLDAWDPRDERGAYYDELAFVGMPGQEITVTMLSSDFDALLVLGWWHNGRWEELARNDDAGEGTDSEIRIPLPREALYALRAGALYEGDAGAYQVLLSATEWTQTSDTVSWEPLVIPGVDTVLAYPNLIPFRAETGRIDRDAVREDAPYQEWMLLGAAGETVTVTLTSRDFDALLQLGRYRGGEWLELARDDDGAGGTDSEITLTLPDDDWYVVRTGALYAGEAGSYDVHLSSDAGGGDMLDSAVVEAQPLVPGTEVEGVLRAGDPSADLRYYHLYRFRGRAGETFTLTLRSGEFDAYLFVAGERTGEKLATDDDGGGGRDARVTFTLADSGEYLVRVTTVRHQEAGHYTLRLDRH